MKESERLREDRAQREYVRRLLLELREALDVLDELMAVTRQNEKATPSQLEIT